MSATKNSRKIKAEAKTIYNAFADPKALEYWLVPGEMIGKVKNFDFKVGGGYQMSLFYPASDKTSQGKTTDREDRYTAKFLELVPDKKIVQEIRFHSADPQLVGEMIMEVTFIEEGPETTVTFMFTNIPKGIRPEDNEAGTESSLKKLAKYVE